VHTCCGDFLHEEPQIQTPDRAQPDRGRFNFALVLAVAAVLIILVALFAWPGRQSPPGAAPQASHLPFGPAEQAYAPKIRVEVSPLTRAENFLHQEVTTLSGELVNTGDRAVSGVEITIEFFDDMNQIALREQRAALAPGAPPLAPGEHRSFEVSFEHISSSWNRQQPLVRVTGLQF
jgi:hypothetical protein